MTAIELCRTAALGEHVEACDQCGHRRIAFNSCRDRHCPRCQSLTRAQWLEDRRAELLDTQYFHVVFTLPEGIATIAYQNKALVYGLLFRALSHLFRRLFLEHLEKAFDAGKLQFFSDLQRLNERNAFRHYLTPLRKTDWAVYAKPPFAGPEQVLDSVGRYTHRVAISNNRLIDTEDGAVRFRWKDYRHGDRQKVMSVSADEFIRRFLLHVLPQGFHRIRY